MLIRPRLETIKTVISEYQLQLKVKYVVFAENKADVLRRMLNKWLLSTGPEPCCGAIAVVPDHEIASILQASEHPGVRRSFYFCRKLFPATTRAKYKKWCVIVRSISLLIQLL